MDQKLNGVNVLEEKQLLGGGNIWMQSKKILFTMLFESTSTFISKLFSPSWWYTLELSVVQ